LVLDMSIQTARGVTVWNGWSSPDPSALGGEAVPSAFASHSSHGQEVDQTPPEEMQTCELTVLESIRWGPVWGRSHLWVAQTGKTSEHVVGRAVGTIRTCMLALGWVRDTQ
jgi:hypothetical protein